MKFENERCLECSIWAMFFSSSLVDSISARLRRRILSDMLIRLESKEPAHGALSSHGDSLENLVAMNALVTADTQRSGVHEIDTGAFSKKNFFDKNKQWDSDFLLLFHKPVIRNRSRKKMTTMFTYIIDIEMFQVSEPTHVKHYEYGHNLGIGKKTRFVSMPLCVINGMFFYCFIKKMQKSSAI